METEPTIHFRGMKHSPAIDAAVRERLERLERFYGRITSCTVMVEAPHRHGHKGRVYHVGVDLTAPIGRVVVRREPEEDRAHEDVYVAIRDSFNAAERRLEDLARVGGGVRVKAHPDVLHGTVARLDAEGRFGFIATADGEEFYFSDDAVTGGWEQMKVGRAVRFRGGKGDRGPFASSVTPV
jgi:cold shock CspA family protein/ribosome-associated translation inhibitor RaiA